MLEAVVKTRVIIQIVVLDKVKLEDTFKAIQNLVASLAVQNLAFAATHIPFTLVINHRFAAFMAVDILVALVVIHNLAFAAIHIPFTLFISHSLAAFMDFHILVALVAIHNLPKK